jgi:hypothetical protein
LLEAKPATTPADRSPEGRKVDSTASRKIEEKA